MHVECAIRSGPDTGNTSISDVPDPGAADGLPLLAVKAAWGKTPHLPRRVLDAVLARARDLGAMWFDRRHVGQVLEQLRLHVPPGSPWGFNYEDDRGWAWAEASVDLEGHVRAALATP